MNRATPTHLFTSPEISAKSVWDNDLSNEHEDISACEDLRPSNKQQNNEEKKHRKKSEEKRNHTDPKTHSEAFGMEIAPDKRPPTRHIYDPSNLAKGCEEWNQSPMGSQMWATPSRPTSASSMKFALDDGISNPVLSELDLLKMHKEVQNQGNAAELAVVTEGWRKKKRIAIAVVLIAVCVIAGAICAAVFLSRNETGESKDGPSTTNNPTNTPTDTSPTVMPSYLPPFIPTTDPVVYGGSWSAWGEWSQCSESCAVGFQQRSRSCESVNLACQGVDTQQRRCNTVLCPIQEPEATWTTWNAWVACSQSCGGGTQTRSRSCVSTNDSLTLRDSCVGSEEQSRQCNDFACPDCERECLEGSLSSFCSHCECSENHTGQILSSDNLPLDNATIAPAHAPYAVLTISSEGGYFEISGVCQDESYVLSRDGYVDTEITFTHSNLTFTMQRVVSLQIVRTPERVVSITGEDFLMCCEANGIPPPNYYEWIKAGDVVYTDETSGTSTFMVSGATNDDTGYYTCRASNDYSAIYSAVVPVLVEDSADDFCTSQPQSNVVTLPEGCVYQNETTIDKGACETNACYGAETGGCGSTSGHCCGPVTMSTVAVQCDDYTFPVSLVTSCGCTVCQRPTLTIYGFAGARDGTPLYFGDIYWNGTLVTNTSYDGTFSFTVDSQISRASVLFVDSYNLTFMDSTYVFEMPTNSEDSQYIRVSMLRRGQTFELNAVEQSTIAFNSTAIDIPARAFYTSEGELYEGNVRASVTTINPTDLEELASAPGDFSVVDDEGDLQQLLSYGMFALVFEDDDGNRLSIPGEVTITISSDSFESNETDSEVKVWTLNPSTGLWEFAGDLEEIDDENSGSRKKRQLDQRTPGQRLYRTTLRGITISTRWYNFDAISRQTCVVKVRLFESEAFNEDFQLSSGNVFVVLQDTNGYNSLTTNRVRTDLGNNGYCMVLPCESHRSRNSIQFRGFIFANYGSEELVPANQTNTGLQNNSVDLESELSYAIDGNKIQVDFNESLIYYEGLMGPFYDWDLKWMYSTVCSNATFGHNHFRFSRQTCLVETDAYSIIPRLLNTSLPEHLLLWYDITSHFPLTNQSPFTRRLWAYKSCYIKVIAPRNTIVEAVSYVADDRHLWYGNGSTVYGVRQDCARYGAVCLQIRPPGSPRIAPYDANTHALDFEEKTLVNIRTLDRTYSVIDIAQDLLTARHLEGHVLTNISAYENRFQMHVVPTSSYGAGYGIYCHQGETEEVAEQALYMCRNGDGSRVAREDTTEQNPALVFGLAPLARGTDCKTLYDGGYRQDGIYTINPFGMEEFDVYCELDPVHTDYSDGGGWTVFQRRVDASTDFYRGWSDYVEGFGELDGNLWLGLDKLAQLTMDNPVEMHVYMENFYNQKYYAVYSSFKIANEHDKYRLSISGYNGNATNTFDYHNGYQFSTFDNDNDADDGGFVGNCAEYFRGAWWYNECYHWHLNGVYQQNNGLTCINFSSGSNCLRKTVMKLRPYN